MISTSFELPKEDPEAVRKVRRARREPMAVFLRRLIGRELASVKATEVDDIERRALRLADNGGSEATTARIDFDGGAATVNDERMCAECEKGTEAIRQFRNAIRLRRGVSLVEIRAFETSRCGFVRAAWSNPSRTPRLRFDNVTVSRELRDYPTKALTGMEGGNKRHERSDPKSVMQQALGFLRRGNLVGYLPATIHETGLLGEDANALLSLAVKMSTKSKDPLNLAMIGESGVGKTAIVAAVLRLFGDQDEVITGRMYKTSLVRDWDLAELLGDNTNMFAADIRSARRWGSMRRTQSHLRGCKGNRYRKSREHIGGGSLDTRLSGSLTLLPRNALVSAEEDCYGEC